MSLFRNLFGLQELNQDELPEEITPGPPLPANEQALLEKALRSTSSYFHPEDRDYRYVKEKTSQAIREWLSVDPEGTVTVPSDMVKYWTLTQDVVSRWVGCYITRGVMLRMAKDGTLTGGAGPALSPPIDGAKEHEKVIAATKEYWEKLEEVRREVQERTNLSVSVQRLTKLANTPVDYEQVQDSASEGLRPASVYGEFAAQLRQENLDESTVFDMVTELSRMVQQSQAVFPQLSPSLAKQLEARVLLSYYKEQQNKAAQAILARSERYERQQQESDRNNAKWEQGQATDALEKISEQVSSLNATTEHEAQDVSTMKWLHIIDGLFGH